jgi:hypothetical protein
MIRFLKERLSTAERANGDGRWVPHLEGVLLDYNRKLIAGTKIRRNSVNQDNYLSLVGQLSGADEPSMLFNMAETFRAPSGLARFLWRHAVGDPVLLARRVDYDLKKRNYFEKASVKGTFGPTVYKVKACRTKLSGDLFICPVYELHGLTGLYYESELSPANYARRQPGGAEQQPPQPPAPAVPPPGRRRRSRRAAAAARRQ